MSNNIVMAFAPQNIVGCLLKKGLKGGSQASQDPLATPLIRDSQATIPGQNVLGYLHI